MGYVNQAEGAPTHTCADSYPAKCHSIAALDHVARCNRATSGVCIRGVRSLREAVEGRDSGVCRDFVNGGPRSKTIRMDL